MRPSLYHFLPIPSLLTLIFLPFIPSLYIIFPPPLNLIYFIPSFPLLFYLLPVVLICGRQFSSHSLSFTVSLFASLSLSSRSNLHLSFYFPLIYLFYLLLLHFTLTFQSLIGHSYIFFNFCSSSCPLSPSFCHPELLLPLSFTRLLFQY